MSSDEESQDVDQRIADMYASIVDLTKRRFVKSALELADDMARLARREQRLIPLLKAQFYFVVQADKMFQSRRGREVAVELISLLENSERARRIQANYYEPEFARICSVITTCAYDNLATHTGEILGYNSDGMHQCIADGISVCHRTGKLDCVGCFRLYASNVYLASDDVGMALHYATMVASQQKYDSGSDKRWLGARNRARILTLTGELTAARDTLIESLELAKSFHNPFSARLESLCLLETALWLIGEQGLFSDLTGETPGGRGLPVGENEWFDSRWDYRDATIAWCQGDFARAIDLVSRWDQRFLHENLATEWFEARLRLIAIHRKVGDFDKATKLAQPLSKRAQLARDWMTTRRLGRLIDQDALLTPNAMLTAPLVGPFASTITKEPVELTADLLPITSDNIPKGDEDFREVNSSPIAKQFQQILDELHSSEDWCNRQKLLENVLAIPVEQFVNPNDAALFLKLLPILLYDGAPYTVVWKNGEAVASRFPQTSFVVSLLASLGDTLSSLEDSGLSERIEASRIEALFRKSLDLDPDNAPNHNRAANFHHRQGNIGEAERCLARAFRLKRDDGQVAMQLAEIYRTTDRPRDALAVLDLALREGCRESQVAWIAAHSAIAINQYQSLLTYIDRFESLLPDQKWVGYYRAIGYLELGNPKKAMEALDLEEQRAPEHAFGIEILRACAASALDQPEQYRTHLEKVLEFKWSTVDYFTLTDLQSLCERLWNASACLPETDGIRLRLLDRLLLAGLATESLFEEQRMASGTEEPVNYYRCVLSQPLDERWADFDGRLKGQDNWTDYRCLWGIMAPDEEAAGRMAMAEQAKCYHLPATVEELQCLGDFNEVPGIIWQGARWHDKPTVEKYSTFEPKKL